MLYASFLNYYDAHIIKMFSVARFSTQLSTFPTTNSHKVADALFKWQCIHLLYTQKNCCRNYFFTRKLLVNFTIYYKETARLIKREILV